VREGGDASEIPVDISVLYNMRQFVKYSRFKQFALRVIIAVSNFNFMVLPFCAYIIAQLCCSGFSKYSQ
jgi:hypothetical protein